MNRVILFFILLLLVFNAPFTYPVNAQSNFKDLGSDHWASNEIQLLVKKEIISGYPDGTFQPEKTISRLEAVIMLLRAKGIREFSSVPDDGFVDVDEETYGGNAIAKSVELGFISGKIDTKGNKIFDPNGKLSRAEMAKILAFGFDLTPNSTINFSDVHQDHWAYDSIQAIASNGISTGYGNGKYGVNDNITRSQFAVMLARVLDESLRIQPPKIPEKTPLTVYVGNEKVIYDVNPIIEDGIILVPFKETFKFMGANVEWNQEEQLIYATKDEKYIKMSVDSSLGLINGEEIILSKPPIAHKSTIMVPLRLVVEALGGTVQFDNINKVIKITMPKFNVEFLTKEQDQISNLKYVEDVEMVGNRRLMLSDNPEILNANTITSDNVTLWNDIVKKNNPSQEHRVYGWHVNKLNEEVTVGVTIENLSTTNTIKVEDLKGISRTSPNTWSDFDIGLPISEAVLNEGLLAKHLNGHSIGTGESLLLGSFNLNPNDTIGFLNDFTVVKTSGTGELNYIIRTVLSRNNGDLTNIKTNPVPVDKDHLHPRGVWSSSEMVATLPTYNVDRDEEMSYSISNGNTDNLLNAQNSLVNNESSISNKGHYGVVYKVKIPFVNESKEEKTIQVRMASRGGLYRGTVKTKDGVYNIPGLEPMKDVANVMNWKTIENKGFIELDIMHAGGSSLPVVVNISTLQ